MSTLTKESRMKQVQTQKQMQEQRRINEIGAKMRRRDYTKDSSK